MADDDEAPEQEGPRDHDAVMADARPLNDAELKEVDARLKTMLSVDVHLREIKNRTLKLQAHYLATLAVGFDIDVELLQKTIECCLTKPTPTLHKAYNAAAKSLGIARRNADIEDLSRRLENPDLDERVRKKYTERREKYKDEPIRPSTSPAIEQLLAKIRGNEKLPIHPIADPFSKERRMFEAKCHELGLALPTPEQLHAWWLGQYEAVRREFQDEHARCAPILTEEIRKWFKGKRHNYVDGVQFWRDYAVLCGYVDDAGEPLPFDTRFHVDHIMERRLDRKKEDKGNIGSYAMDHYTNYAIVHKGINGWFNDCFGAHETISDVKQWMHGILVCNTISNLVRTRAQQSDQLAQAASNSTLRLKFLRATLEPGARHVVPCGTRIIGARKRKRDYRALASGVEEDGDAADAPAETTAEPPPTSPETLADATVADVHPPPSAAEPAEAESSKSDDGSDTEVDEENEPAAAPAPAAASSSEEQAAAAPVKVPGNQKGAMRKPDGSVPVAGEEWAVKADGSLGKFVKGKVTDGSRQFRVCASGQACKAKHGRISVMDVTGGRGNTVCDYCFDAAKGIKTHNSNPCPAAHLPRPEKAAKCLNNAAHKCTGKHNGVQMCEGRFCNGTCANLVAEVLWKKEHEGVDYPEGFEWPPKKGAKGKRKRAA